MSATDLRVALDHHRAGRVQEVEAAYREFLAREPDHVEAVHGLGAVEEGWCRMPTPEELTYLVLNYDRLMVA
jgi:hypothetical protein